MDPDQQNPSMQLLVSVASREEARAALAGGADLIDAKDPYAGALGAVQVETLRTIHGVVAGRRPVTAALGDARDEVMIARLAREFAATGTAFVKVGFLGLTSRTYVGELLTAAVCGAREGCADTGVVAVAYADADRVSSLEPRTLARLAPEAGARGLLIDTADKEGASLMDLIEPFELAALSREVHAEGLFLGAAGKLSAADLPSVRDAGIDIAGVRGAACRDGRMGRIAADLVRQLREHCEHPVVSEAGRPV